MEALLQEVEVVLGAPEEVDKSNSARRTTSTRTTGRVLMATLPSTAVRVSESSLKKSPTSATSGL